MADAERVAVQHRQDDGAKGDDDAHDQAVLELFGEVDLVPDDVETMEIERLRQTERSTGGVVGRVLERVQSN